MSLNLSVNGRACSSIFLQEVTHAEQHFSLLWEVLAKEWGSDMPRNLVTFTSYCHFVHGSHWSHIVSALAEIQEGNCFAVFSSTFIHMEFVIQKLTFAAGKKPYNLLFYLASRLWWMLSLTPRSLCPCGYHCHFCQEDRWAVGVPEIQPLQRRGVHLTQNFEVEKSGRKATMLSPAPSEQRVLCSGRGVKVIIKALISKLLLFFLSGAVVLNVDFREFSEVGFHPGHQHKETHPLLGKIMQTVQQYNWRKSGGKSKDFPKSACALNLIKHQVSTKCLVVTNGWEVEG